MANSVTIHDKDGNALDSNLNVNTITITVDSDLVMSYDGRIVGTVTANIQGSTFIIEFLASSPVAPVRLTDVDMTPVSAGPIEGGLVWAEAANGGMTLRFTTPTTINHQLEWTINDGAPPVPLKVKVKRIS